MQHFKKIAFWNFIILLVMNLIAFGSSQGSYESEMSYVVVLAFLIILLIGINFIIGVYFIIKQDIEKGRNFMICSAVVLLIGFSTCIGGVSLMEM
jgi:uncharacterized membrane protein YozB (DUF420 family)